MMGAQLILGCLIPDGSWSVSVFPQNATLSTCLLTSQRHLSSAGTGRAPLAAGWLLSPCCPLVAALALASASVPVVPRRGHCHAQKVPRPHLSFFAFLSQPHQHLTKGVDIH